MSSKLADEKTAKFSNRKFIASFSLDAFRIARHDHPLEVDRNGPAGLGLLGDDDLAAQVDPAVDDVDGTLADLLAVDVQDHAVSEKAIFTLFCPRIMNLIQQASEDITARIEPTTFENFLYDETGSGPSCKLHPAAMSWS